MFLYSLRIDIKCPYRSCNRDTRYFNEEPVDTANVVPGLVPIASIEQLILQLLKGEEVVKWLERL